MRLKSESYGVQDELLVENGLGFDRPDGFLGGGNVLRSDAV